MRLKLGITFGILVVGSYACSSASQGGVEVPPPGDATAGTAATAAPPTAGVAPSATPMGAAGMRPVGMQTPPAAGSGATPTNPPASSAGSAAPPPATTPTMPTMQNPPAGATPYPDARGKCTINSGWADDRACLVPPAPGEGIQIHVGPSNYQDPAEIAKFILRAGEEKTECWSFHTPNEAEVVYQTFELSGRQGTHHIINTMYRTDFADGTAFGVCNDPGTGTNGDIIDNLPGASKAYMPRGHVAPENEMIGRKIPPKAASQADMHYFNFGDKDLLREFWMNIYFAPPGKVTIVADQIRGMGGLAWNALPIPAHSEAVYPYECAVTGDGRILALLGHYHAHGRKFTASVRRAGTNTVEKVFEMYDYMDPAMFEYDSITTNPIFSDGTAGATSGILNVKNGDVIMWDCHIVNDSDVGLTYTNNVKTGEMCNLWGASLGISQINCVLP
jgi:hypothetical protein